MPICNGLGHFPSSSDLREFGRHDICCQISRRGGYRAWSQRTGFNRRWSDSDTGWDGEDRATKALCLSGFKVTRHHKNAPFDLTLDDCLRIDVKSAYYAEYGIGKNSACRGWFYRMAKNPTADIIMLYQLDTGDAYYLPWFICPITNVTIARDGGKYAEYKNNVGIVRQMRDRRAAELLELGLSEKAA